MSGILVVVALLIGFTLFTCALLFAGYAMVRLFQETMTRVHTHMLETMQQTVQATRRAIEGDVPADNKPTNDVWLPAMEEQREWFLSEEEDNSPDIPDIPGPWNAATDLRDRTVSIEPGEGIPDVVFK